MARQEAPDIKITEELQPRAQIYDTYVRPAPVAKSPLWDVAEALGRFDANISSAMHGMKGQQDADALEQGKAAFWENNKEGAAEGVRQGLIPAWGNPNYQKGFDQEAGHAASVEFNAKVGGSYTQNDVKSSDDPGAFDNWFRSEVQGFYKGKSSAFIKGAEGGIRAAHQQYSTQYRKDRDEVVKLQSQNVLTKAIGATVEEGVVAGKGSETGLPDKQAIAGSVDTFRQNAYKLGMEKAVIDKLTIDTVIVKAKEHLDESLLDVFGHLKDPSGPQLGKAGGQDNPVSLADTAYGQEEILKARSAIQGARHTMVERERIATERADKTAHDNALRTLTQEMAKNPMYVPPDEVFRPIEKTDPDFRVKYLQNRQAFLNGNVQEDPTKITALYTDIITNGDGMTKVHKAMSQGTLLDPKSVEKAIEFAALQDKSATADAKILDASGWKIIENGIMSRFKDPSFKGSLWREEGLTQAGTAALFDARLAAMQWSAAHPKATKIEQEVFLQSLGKQMADSQSTDASNNPVYTQPEGIRAAPGTTAPGGASAPSGEQQQGQQPAAPNPTPESAPAGTNAAPQVPPNPMLPPGSATSAPRNPVETMPPWTKGLIMLPKAPTLDELRKGGMDPKEVDKFVTESAQMGWKNPQQRLNKVYEIIQRHKEDAARALGPGTAKGVLSTGDNVDPASAAAPTLLPEPDMPQAPILPGVPGKQGAADGLTQLASGSLPTPDSTPDHASEIMRAIGAANIPGIGQVNFDNLPPEAVARVRAAIEGAMPKGGLKQQASLGTQPQDGSKGRSSQGSTDSMERGSLSAKQESGKDGSASISYDRTGGWSFGRYQFASGGTVASGSAVKTFINTLKGEAPDLAEKLEAAGGQPAARSGSEAFKAAWREAARDPRFRAAEEAAANHELIDPANNRLKARIGLDVTTRSNALQEVLISSAVQHGGGGAASLFQKALAGKDPAGMTDEQIIKALYHERRKVEIYFRSSTPQVQQAVFNRFVREEKEALAMLSKENAGTRTV